MGAQTLLRRELRAAVEAAVLTEVEKVGPSGLKRDIIVRQFEGGAADRATLYRWISAVLASGQPGMVVAKAVRAVSAERASKRAGTHATEAPISPLTPEAIEEIGVAVLEAAPRPIGAVDVTGAGSAIALVGHLQERIELAQQIIKQARGPDGTIRLTKTALAASEHLRRTVETSMKLAASLREISRIDDFLAEVVAEVEKEAPALAERLLGRLMFLTDRWSGKP